MIEAIDFDSNILARLTDLHEDGVFSADEAFNVTGSNKIELDHLVCQGQLDLVDKTSCLYSSSNSVVSLDDCAVVQHIFPNSIFCCNTSLYLQGYSTLTPVSFDVCFKQKQKFNSDRDIEQYQDSTDAFNEGVVDVKTDFGYTVKSYSIEKSICQLLLYDYYDPNVLYEALGQYRAEHKDLAGLVQCARKMGIEYRLKKTLSVRFGQHAD